MGGSVAKGRGNHTGSFNHEKMLVMHVNIALRNKLDEQSIYSGGLTEEER